MKLGKLLGKVAKFAAKNPELAAVVLPVAGGVVAKAAPKLVPLVKKAKPVIGAVIKGAR